VLFAVVGGELKDTVGSGSINNTLGSVLYELVIAQACDSC
jgi:hypothetical protein